MSLSDQEDELLDNVGSAGTLSRTCVEGRISKNKAIFEGNDPNLLVGRRGSRPMRFLHLLLKPVWQQRLLLGSLLSTKMPQFVLKMLRKSKTSLLPPFARLHLNVNLCY